MAVCEKQQLCKHLLRCDEVPAAGLTVTPFISVLTAALLRRVSSSLLQTRKLAQGHSAVILGGLMQKPPAPL